MNRVVRWALKILKYVAATLVVVLLGALAFLLLAFPKAEPAAPGAFERTPERLAQGRYLLHHVVDCLNCHSPRDWNRYSGPVIEGSEGQGAAVMDSFLKGNSANITPYGIGDWTDGEVARAITSGINRDGDAMHPLMPYDVYLHLAQEDVEAIVVALRTLPPITNDVAVAEQDSILKSLLVFVVRRLVPKPYVAKSLPDPADSVARGKYLAEIGQCTNCHGSRFKGGFTYPLPSGQVVAAADISSTSKTRAGSWSRDNFIGVFKSFSSDESREIAVPAGEPNTIMAWTRFAGMSEDDLGAIYDYIRSRAPETPITEGEGVAEGSDEG